MPLISPLKNVLAVQYEKDNLMIQAECESALTQNRINSDYGEHVTPAYTVWNMKGGYKFNISEIQLDAGLGVTNLLNKVYYEHLDWSRINRPGRSLEVYVKVSY